MKKTFLYLMAVISAAVSCQLADVDSIKTGKADYPVFTASIETGTKVALDGTALSWESGDRIVIAKDGKTAIYEALSSGETTTFTYVEGEFGEGEGPYVAYYPASLVDNVFVSSYVSASGELKEMPMRAEVATAEENLNFCAFGGLLKFKVEKDPKSEPLTLSQIILKSNEAIAGKFVDNTADGNVAAEITESTGTKTLRINLTSPVELTSEPAVIYLPVPANTYTSGLSITACTDKGTEKVVTTKDLILERAHIKGINLVVSNTTAEAPVARTTNNGGASWTPYSTLQDAIDGVMPEGTKENCIVEVLKSYTMTVPVYSNEAKNFTIDGKNCTIDASALDSLDIKANGITYLAAMYFAAIDNIDIKDLTIDGGCTAEPLHYRAIIMSKYDSATQLNLTGNTTITGFYSECAGAAMRLLATLHMRDNSTICDCQAINNSGGAISLNFGNTYCRVYMYDNATITGCNSNKNGGGIYNGSGYMATSVTMNGNSSITDCHADAGSGGAINGYNLTMNDNAEISGCSAKNFGGAVRIDGTFKMNGTSHITDCAVLTGTGYGAVYITTGAKTKYLNTMNDNSYVADCYVIAGSIYCNARALTMTGNACVKNCSATGNGGGISMYGADAVLTMSDNSSIIDCTSGSNGGGLRLISSAKANIGMDEGDNPSITGNDAKTAGSTFSLPSGTTLTIGRGTFSTNSASHMISTAGTVNIKGGFFKQEGTGNMMSNTGTCKISNEVSDCYISHSTSLVATGYKKVELDDSDPYKAMGYKYKIVAE